MRKLYLLFTAIVALSSSLIAQNSKATNNQPGSRLSTSGSRPSNSITRSLVTQLKLNPAQEAKTNNAIFSFVAQKKKAYTQNKSAGLKNMDKNKDKSNAGKPQPINTAISDFNNELKTIFTATQYSTYLGLKPKTNDPKNPLSFLFY